MPRLLRNLFSYAKECEEHATLLMTAHKFHAAHRVTILFVCGTHNSSIENSDKHYRVH